MRLRILRTSAGFTYIGALVMVVILGIMASRAVVVWKTAMQREKETELIFRGMQYMDALRRWYWPKGFPSQTAQNTTLAGTNVQVAPPAGSNPAYPASLPTGVPGPKELKDLLKGSGPSPQPCLRRLFKDPITGKDFEPIIGADGRIIGVHSTSEATPIKQANFPFDLDPSAVEGKSSYKEWRFSCLDWPKPLGTAGAPKIKGAKSVQELGGTGGGSTDSATPPPPPPPPAQ